MRWQYGQNIIDKLRGKNINQFIKELSLLKEQTIELKYILNNCISIQNFPKAKGNLRIRQLIMVEYLRFFNFLTQKYNLEFWLDYGSALGAFRHKGFIPWDDDIDIGMMREDYNRVIPLLKDDLESIGFYINCGENGYNNPIIRILHKNYSFGQIDIFPYDIYPQKINNNGERLNILKDNQKAHLKFIKIWNKNKNIHINNLINSIRNNNEAINSQKENFSIITGCEFPPDVIENYEDVFPLRKIQFEDLELLTYKNIENYLEHIYGNWMSFPDKLFIHGIDFYIKNQLNNTDNSIEFLNYIKQKVSGIIEKNKLNPLKEL